MTTQFDKIYRGASMEVGKFRVAASGMAWKGIEGEAVTAIPTDDVKWAQWFRVARHFQLRIGLKDRRRETFDGFQREDHDKLASLLKQHFAIHLETKEVSFKGWNWGVTDFQGQDLAFLIQNKLAFELPLQYVANSNIAGRTEVSLEFNNATNSRTGPDEMVEIRFHVPGTHTKVKGSDAGSQKSDAEEEEETSAAQAFHDAIKDKAEIGQISGDVVLSFEEVLVTTPRGRYDLDVFPDFLRLRGKTYDYKILYSSISRLFLLPKDDQHVFFIFGLSNPIRQGQTRYQYLVMQFSKEEETTAVLNMEEEEIAKYERLQKNYEEPTFQVVSGVFRALSKKKIIGAGSFKSRDGHPAIKANLKAVQGELFLLEKYIFFISKQPTLIELTDIHQVVYSRVGGVTSARTFDIKIVTKSGPEFSFSSINKEEHDATELYLKEKKVKVKNEAPLDQETITAAVDDSGDSDSDGSAPKIRLSDNEDSEADEDFKASDSDSGSPSESDSDSDGAATASDASGDREMTTSKKAKAKGKAKAKAKDGDGSTKKAPKKKAKSSDAEEDDDKDKPKKTAAKHKPKKKAEDAMDVDNDDERTVAPKPKPKSKPKKKDVDEDAMNVDSDKPKPKPRPKPVPKKDKGDDDEPPAKKIKVSG